MKSIQNAIGRGLGRRGELARPSGSRPRPESSVVLGLRMRMRDKTACMLRGSNRRSNAFMPFLDPNASPIQLCSPDGTCTVAIRKGPYKRKKLDDDLTACDRPALAPGSFGIYSCDVRPPAIAHVRLTQVSSGLFSMQMAEGAPSSSGHWARRRWFRLGLALSCVCCDSVLNIRRPRSG